MFTCFALPAYAQVTPAEKAAAEALFDRGLAALREGRLDEACARLEQSNAIERGIGTMLYLAECYEKSGRTASAWALFREAASEAQAAGQLERASAGQKRADRLESVLARLTLDVSEPRRVPGLEITRNGINVPQGAWGVPLPVDPGEQRIKASAPSYGPFEQTLQVAAGPSLTRFELPQLMPKVAAIETPETRATLSTPTPNAGSLPPVPLPAKKRGLSTLQIVGIAVGSAGVVLLAVGSGYGIKALQKNDDAKELGCRGKTCPTDRGTDLTDQALKASKIANAGMFGGAALVAGGLLTYLLAPKDSETKLSAAFDGRTATLGVGGAF